MNDKMSETRIQENKPSSKCADSDYNRGDRFMPLGGI